MITLYGLHCNTKPMGHVHLDYQLLPQYFGQGAITAMVTTTGNICTTSTCWYCHKLDNLQYIFSVLINTRRGYTFMMKASCKGNNLRYCIICLTCATNDTMAKRNGNYWTISKVTRGTHTSHKIQIHTLQFIKLTHTSLIGVAFRDYIMKGRGSIDSTLSLFMTSLGIKSRTGNCLS